MSFRRTTIAVAAALIAATVLPQGAAAASPMPSPPSSAPAEPLPGYQAQNECSATAKPGVVAFKELLLARYPGSRNLGIVRACHLGARSEHKEGRAFDWGVRVDRAREAGYARDLTTWLLATDSRGVRYSNARRLGIMYMIWNRRIWSASRAAEGWRAYSGPNPHTDHVHFSFTWPAAYKLTSYWTGKPFGIGSAGGAVDRAFGRDGWTAYSTSRSVRLVTQLQRGDDRLLSVGQSTADADLVLADVTAGGRPGTTFGGTSRVRAPLPAGTILTAATTTPGGGVVVAGSVPAAPAPPTHPPAPEGPPQRDILLMRVDAGGEPDPRFGTRGIAVLDLGGDDDVAAVSATSDGKLLLAGTSVVDGISRLAVARTGGTGALDTSFGSGGVVISTTRGAAAGTSILLLPSNEAVVGCRTASAGCLLRLTAAGQPDADFGSGGTALTTAVTGVATLAAGANGRIFAAGRDAVGTATVVRFRSTGARDTGFGRSGVTTAPIAGCTADPTGIVVRWDGGPVVSGRLTGCAAGAFVARWVSDGAIDPRWSDQGIAKVGPPTTVPGGLLLQSDGRIVLPATVGTSPETDVTGMRFTVIGPVPGRLAASRSTAITTYGSPVTVSGVVVSTADHSRTAGVPVTFYARRLGATTWTAIGTAKTNSSGKATLQHTPSAGMSYSARSARTQRVFAATSGVVSVSVRPRLNTALTTPLLRRGTPVVLSVTARPAHPGRRIYLQRFIGGRWQTLRTPMLGSTGVARVRLVYAKPLKRKYRWVLPGRGAYATGYSRSVVVRWT